MLFSGTISLFRTLAEVQVLKEIIEEYLILLKGSIYCLVHLLK